MGLFVFISFFFLLLWLCILLCCLEYPLTFFLCIAILSEYPLVFLLCHTLWIISFLQTACADCIKKTVFSAVAVYLGNSFWSCFIQKIHLRNCVLLVLYFILHSGFWCVLQASFIWRCCWFKSTKPFWSVWVYNQIAAVTVWSNT